MAIPDSSDYPIKRTVVYSSVTEVEPLSSLVRDPGIQAARKVRLYPAGCFGKLR